MENDFIDAARAQAESQKPHAAQAVYNAIDELNASLLAAARAGLLVDVGITDEEPKMYMSVDQWYVPAVRLIAKVARPVGQHAPSHQLSK